MSQHQNDAQKDLKKMIAQLQARIDRVEGKQEDRFWFVSSAFSMKKVRESLAQLQRQSMSDANGKEVHVVLEGPVGAGQEGIARMIHVSSKRGKGPWLRVVGGSTEAHDRDLFEALACAAGGTIYIENIENLSASTQKRLATALSEADVRCIATCMMDPDDARDQGLFQQELAQTLGQMWIQIPALIERQEDILLLAKAMGEKIAAEMGRKFEGFGPDAEQWLTAQPWNGNVRELWSTIERSMYGTAAAAEGPVLNVTQAPVAKSLTEIGQSPQSTYTDLKKQWVDHFEKEYLKGLIQRHRGNVSASAREARLDRSNFLRLLRRHGLKAESFRSENSSSNQEASDSGSRAA